MLSSENAKILAHHYKNADAWRIRHQTHEMYTEPKVDFVDWTMQHVALQGNETVLDVGCGPGRYHEYIKQKYPDVRYVGIDYSTGMLEDHSNTQRVLRADMTNIPLPDNTFDVVLANHVLYLAPDIDAALEETKRVLKPGGILVSATNSVTTMPQFRELFRRAILLVSPPGVSREVRVPVGIHHRFALENGSRMLARHYFAVVRHDLPSAFVFDEVEPIMDYLESIRDTREPQLPSNVSWDQVMLIMREQLFNLITTLEKLVVDKLSGVLIATNTSGFIEEFVQMQEKLKHGANAEEV